MAGPPRYIPPGFGMMGYTGAPGFFVPNPLLRSTAPTTTSAPVSIVKTPVTTIFVGNISDKCPNEFIRLILSECGKVAQWKRIQGSNGKFQAFGFCDYESPDGTLRALRILNNYQLGEKKLVVKAEDKTKDLLRDFWQKRRVQNGLSVLKLAPGELPVDEDALKEDEEVKQRIIDATHAEHPELIPPEDDGELAEPEKDKEKKEEGGEGDKDKAKDRGKAEDGRKRRRSSSGSASPRRRDSRKSRRSSRRRRRSSSSSSSSSSRSSSSSSDSSGGRRRRRSGSRARSSEDSDDVRERREQKALAKKKQADYEKRCAKWEEREKRQARFYEKEEQREAQRKRDVLKEARKLKHFLEDYDDLKDDAKYYKSSSLFQRRRDFEKEREADAKDRQREQAEIDELKKQILAEGGVADADEEARRRHKAREDALLKKLRADSSPNPHVALGQKAAPDEADESSSSEDDEDADQHAAAATGWTTVGSVDTPLSGSDSRPPRGARSESGTPTPRSPAREKMLPSVKPGLSGVFGEDVDEDEHVMARKKLKPFEISREERLQAMTAEEKKKLIKELIDGIPTAKDELFARDIDWTAVDKQLVSTRVRPWVSKKMSEYIGEDEPSLVDFVCEKIEARTAPDKILADIAMVLDDEAEVFVVKMWRLLIYETEAKKLGLPLK